MLAPETLRNQSKLSADKARELLDYDPATGLFRWKVSIQGQTKAGDIAGCENGNGYRVITVSQVSYLAPRIAWLITHGEWPRAFVDHINGNRMDDRIANLREATGSQNQANKGLQRNNKSGRKGVSFNQKRKVWAAFIAHKNKTIWLGYFQSADEAHAAYCHAALRLRGEFARTA